MSTAAGDGIQAASTGPRRALLLALLGVVLVAAIAHWELRPQGELGSLGPADVVYQALRATRAVADYPHVTSIDSYSHHGTRWHLHWPPWLALAYATVARCAGSPVEIHEVAAAIGGVPMAIGVLATLLAALVATRARGGWVGALLAAALVALSGDGLVLFGRGALDHHAMTALVVLALVAARLLGSWPAWGAALVVGFVTTPESVIYATLLTLLVFAAEWLATGERAPRRRDASWLLAPAAAAAVALWLDRLPDPQPPALLDFDLFRLSLLHVLWLVVLGGVATALLPRAASIGRPGRRIGLTVLACGGVAMALAGVLFVTGGVAGTVERLGEARMYVSEERSMFAAELGAWRPWLRVVLLACVIEAIALGRAIWRGEDATSLYGRFALVAAPLVGLVEYRHYRVLAPLVMVAVAVAAVDSIRTVGERLASRIPAAKAAVAVLVALLVAPPFWGLATETRAALEKPSRFDPYLPELVSFLRASTPDPGGRESRARYGIFAPWELGHHINALAGRPVVVDPFNHVGVSEPLSAVIGAPTIDSLAAALERLDARYLVVVDAPAMILRDVDDLSPFAAPVPGFPGHLAYRDSMRGFALFRLALATGDEEGGERLRRVFSGSAKEGWMTVDDGGASSLHWVSRLQVFELRPAG